MRRYALRTIVVASLFFPSVASATSITLNPSLDNTLIQDSTGSLSNALGDIYSGRTNQSDTISRRRGVIKFNVSGSIPGGSTISTAKLRLNLFRVSDASSRNTTIHKVSASWGEGTSFFDGGVGAASTTNDATWIHRFYSATSWTTAGGDFTATASQTCSVGTTTGVYYEWTSNASIVADVQGWLTTPSSNNGWLVKGDESTAGTARRFVSGEGSSNLPELVITYTPFSARGWVREDGNDLDGDGKPDTLWREASLGDLELESPAGSGARQALGRVPSDVAWLGAFHASRAPGTTPVFVRAGQNELVAHPLGLAPTSMGALGAEIRPLRFFDADGDGVDELLVRDEKNQTLHYLSWSAIGWLRGPALKPVGIDLDL